MIKKSFFILLLTVLAYPLSIFGQSYGTALGVRLDGFGATLQQQVATHTTVEAIVQSGFKKQDVTATLLLEQHKNLITKGLNFYTGAGAFHTWYDKSDVTTANLKNAFGISPIMGLELNLGKLVFSGDIKPNIKISGDGKGFSWHSGLSIRYELAGRYFKNDDWKFWKKWKKKS